MAVVHESVNTGSALAVTTVSTSASVTGVNDHLYLASVSVRGNISVSGVAGLGLTWTTVGVQCAGRGTNNCTVFKAQGTVSGDGVVTATLGSTPNESVISVSRYSGASAIGAVIKGNTNGLDGGCSGGTDTTGYSLNITTTAPNSVVYSAVARRGNDHTPGGAYTERSDLDASAGQPAGIATQDRAVATASLVAVDGTLSLTTDWALIALEVLELLGSSNQKLLHMGVGG